MNPASYEFSEAQNAVFKSLAGRMRLFGTVVVLVAVLLIAAAALVVSRLDEPLSLVGLLGLSTVYLLVLGGPQVGIANSFTQILETSKNDIGHLMDALAGLEKVFLLNCVIVVLVLIGAFVVPPFVVPV
jgi:fucose 4-O-acetylase-like acetyltransferase